MCERENYCAPYLGELSKQAVLPSLWCMGCVALLGAVCWSPEVCSVTNVLVLEFLESLQAITRR
jgi:hypothetical protein